ncbi:MAG: NusG domain II-containing protein [Treponema sp.]|nr:NusG domain II-containing protein [Treponema sp.]
MKTLVKKFDVIIILLVAALTFFTAYFAYIKPQGQPRILIRGLDGEWTYPFKTDETIIVHGPLGDTIVRVHENRAWIESSPCNNQTCVASGSVSRQGQWAACLPNSVLLLVDGSRDDDVDAVVW